MEFILRVFIFSGHIKVKHVGYDQALFNSVSEIFQATQNLHSRERYIVCLGFFQCSLVIGDNYEFPVRYNCIHVHVKLSKPLRKKANILALHQMKTWISLDICSVCSEMSLSI